MYKAVAFDAFDTTCQILYRGKPYHKLFDLLSGDKKSAKRLALTTPFSFRDFATMMAKDRADISADLPQLEEELAVELASITTFPDTIDVLYQLQQRGMRLAVISNLAQPYGQRVEDLLTPFVRTFVFSYVAGWVKPEPQIFERLRESLDLPARQILVVGNSFGNDYEAARACGMGAIHLDRNGTNRTRGGIRELTQLLRRI